MPKSKKNNLLLVVELACFFVFQGKLSFYTLIETKRRRLLGVF